MGGERQFAATEWKFKNSLNIQRLAARWRPEPLRPARARYPRNAQRPTVVAVERWALALGRWRVGAAQIASEAVQPALLSSTTT